jgi:hypothetical protein
MRPPKKSLNSIEAVNKEKEPTIVGQAPSPILKYFHDFEDSYFYAYRKSRNLKLQ